MKNFAKQLKLATVLLIAILMVVGMMFAVSAEKADESDAIDLSGITWVLKGTNKAPNRLLYTGKGYVVEPGDVVNALLKSNGVELSVGKSVSSGVKNKDIASVVGIRNCEEITVAKTLGSSRKHNSTSVIAEVIVLTVKIYSIANDVYIMLFVSIFLRPLCTDVVHTKRGGI